MTASPTKCRCTLAPALQAAPSLFASLDSQIVRRQRVSPTAVGWDFLTQDLAAIGTGEVDDRRTISREHAPATIISAFDKSAEIPGEYSPTGSPRTRPAAARTRELYQTFNAIPAGLMRCSRNLHYIAANPAYAKIAGVPLQQIVGRPRRCWYSPRYPKLWHREQTNMSTVFDWVLAFVRCTTER